MVDKEAFKGWREVRYKRLRQREIKTVHSRISRPDLYPVDRDLPWYGFSMEVGHVFSHLDGSMAGTYDHEKGLLKSMVELD
ncbi:MAG: hypothetical protein M0021_16645 [Clostridia bacterium]|nr:hypothetical protein [Clostridia bacterium]